MQSITTLDCRRAGTFSQSSVGVEKDQRSLVLPLGICVSLPAVDGEFDDRTGVSTAGDSHIEMNMKALLATHRLQPTCKRSPSPSDAKKMRLRCGIGRRAGMVQPSTGSPPSAPLR